MVNLMSFEIEEEKHLTNIENFKQIKRRHNKALRIEKKNLSKMFKSENKKKFILMDILFIFFILFNIGALVITNMLVIKTEPEIQLIEANPVVAENYNFQTHPDAKPAITGFMISMFAWTYFIGWYIYGRITLYKSRDFYMFVGTFIFFGISITMDFFNDFGFLLGKIIWG